MAPGLVRVVPLVRMPRTLGFFDYALPDGMTAGKGNLVTVPFRGRKIPGLIIECLKKSDVPASRLKEVCKMIDAPMLGAPVVDALLMIAEESLTSPATTAHALLPTVPKRKLSAKDEPSNLRVIPKTGKREPSLWHDAFTNGPSLFMYDDENGRDLFLQTLQRHAQAADRPVVFIAPRIEIAKAFAKPCDDHATIVTGAGAMGARWKNWMRSRDAKVVAGTALALFTPHKKPFAIVVDEEEASEHLHGDAAPRFDAKRVAEKIADGWGCPIIFLSRTPTVASWRRLGKTLRLLPDERRLETRTVICDFGDEFRSKRFHPVTLSFLTGLDAVMKAKKRAIIIVNRKGDSARLLCRDCGKTTSCGNCGTVLAVHENRLICPQCRGTEPIPDLCHSCRSARLTGSGAGIERVAKFLSERYASVKVRTFTKEAHEPSALDADIVLGTEYLMTHACGRLLSDIKIGFVGTLSADTFLMRLTDAMTGEREFRRLRRLALLAAGHGLPVYLQTSEPELPLYAMLALPPEKWYASELEDRKSANIHPFSGIARLLSSGLNRSKLKKEAEALVSRLKKSKLLMIFEVRIIRARSRDKAWIGISFPVGKSAEVRRFVAKLLPDSWGYDPAPFEPII